MASWNTIFTKTFKNKTTIATGVSWFVGEENINSNVILTDNDKLNRPFNGLTIVNDSDEDYECLIDGKTDKSFHIFAKGTFGISFDDGFFFNTAVLKNLDAGTSVAEKISVTYQKAKRLV